MTPKQTLILWCLLGCKGQAMQKDIVPKVEKSDREALVAGGYITTAKGKRGAIGLEVTDKGWHWAGEHLGDPLPKNYKVLQDWLTLLHRQLGRSGETLADFVTATPDPTPSGLSEHDVRARIEKAYLAVTGGRKAQSISLAKVRAELADLDRSVVDEGLRRILKGDSSARLGQVSDPKALTQEDRDAAYSPAGEPFHLLWIKS
ncbi:MAG: hypothetical protein NTV97_03855 [Alphaproteobacteria bacterium]|nr:hypothetical protein [Alphaproteobacteria bacterium]